MVGINNESNFKRLGSNIVLKAMPSIVFILIYKSLFSTRLLHKLNIDYNI